MQEHADKKEIRHGSLPLRMLHGSSVCWLQIDNSGEIIESTLVSQRRELQRDELWKCLEEESGIETRR